MKAQLRVAFAAFLALASSSWPAAGQTWTLTSAPTDANWYSITCSADGSHLAAANYGYGFIYTSTNSGQTWTATTAPNGWFQCIAGSADGAKLLATDVNPFGGSPPQQIFLSSDSGANWAPANVPAYYWTSVASSADGAKLAAVGVDSGPLPVTYLSSDSGQTWLPANGPTQVCRSVATSADGVRLAASSQSGATFISTNSGLSWSQASPQPPGAVAIAADGEELVVVGFGALSISRDSGQTWSTNTLPVFPFLGSPRAATSADGSTIAALGEAAGGGLGVYMSSDSGATWVQSTVAGNSTNPCAVACSADGCKVFVALSTLGIFSYQVTSHPTLHITSSGQNLLLSWIVPSQPFVLQQSSDLISWSPVTATPALNLSNLNYEATIPLHPGSRFYRLTSP